VREFRDANGVDWIVFLTARSVARDHHLPEEYREGWLAFESAHGEKRRLAPIPEDWESLSDKELAALCAQTAPPTRKRDLAAEELVTVDAGSRDALQPQLRELETRLTSVLGEVCELPPPAKLNTGELIRVEETLALATETAKEAVSLRRRMRANRDEPGRERADFRPQPGDRSA
jgi:hypothetical protein